MPVTFPDFEFKSAAGDASRDRALPARSCGTCCRMHQAREVAVREAMGGDVLRQKARDIEDECLANLDKYLEQMARAVERARGHVHWAGDGHDANNVIPRSARKHRDQSVIKVKTMTSEETHLNAFLTERGIDPVETDLGEYIVQLADHRPSHWSAPPCT